MHCMRMQCLNVQASSWQPCCLVQCCCLPATSSAWLCSPVTPACSMCCCDKHQKSTKSLAEYLCSVAHLRGLWPGSSAT